jgi:hypothetical protein
MLFPPDEDFCTNKPQKTKIDNVGEAFLTWAETNWTFEKLITKGLSVYNDEEESCPYTYLRKIFVDKINELANNKA